LVEIRKVLPLDRKLIEPGADPSTDAQVLHRLENGGRSGHCNQLFAQARDDLPGAGSARLKRSKRDFLAVVNVLF
jgi:hypothetical protein